LSLCEYVTIYFFSQKPYSTSQKLFVFNFLYTA
jgi:hypothetical protein